MTFPVTPANPDFPFYFAPVEDLILPLLRPLEGEIEGLKVRSLIEKGHDWSKPYVLVRRDAGEFTSTLRVADQRFSQRAVFQVETFTDDPDGDQKGADLSHIAQTKLFTAWRRQTVVPGVGCISYIRMSSPPRRQADWATATGVAQYATLPKNLHRYESIYGIVIRPDESVRHDPYEVFRA